MDHIRPAGPDRRRQPFSWVAAAAVVLVAGTACLVAAQSQDASPEARAISFLSAEVPRWPTKNNCFSCHNNGDAARALYTAVGMGYEVEAEALRDTTAWLQEPEAWDDNALGLEFADKKLARIQFAGALGDAMVAGAISDPTPLADAAALIAADQADDGSFPLDTSGSIGSPATYGTALATGAALRALRQAGTTDLAPVIARADAWVRGIEVKSVNDAAGVVLALGSAGDPAAIAQRQRCLELITKGRAPSGGWGAYLTSAVESFDTALVVLALQPLLGRPELAAPAIDGDTLTRMVAGGRLFLLAEQLEDGSWVETTRPAGQQSYAQYISTTGWVTLALLATQ
ncbi:MAG: hypothetical protein QGI10_07270 [Vicinamibacterales bacterium]|nr:hypothetical protein [Vicinamibacterales bacterium]